jgi:hypothetical protein
VTLFGDSDIIQSANLDAGFAITGSNETFHLTGGHVTFNQDSDGIVYGDSTAIAASGGNVHVTTVGDHIEVDSQAAFNEFSVNGTGAIFHTTGDGITFNQNSSGVVYGDSNTISAGPHSAVAMNGNGDTITAGPNSVVVDNGKGNTIYATDSVIVLGPENIGQTITIYGDGNQIDASALYTGNVLAYNQSIVVVRGTKNTVYGNSNTEINLGATTGNWVVGNAAVNSTNMSFTRVASATPSGVYGPINPAAPTGPGIYFPGYSLNGDSSSAGNGLSGGSSSSGIGSYGDSSSDLALSMPWYDLPESGDDSGLLNVLVTGTCNDGVDPIILNLDGRSVETLSQATSSVSFDMQNNGQKVQTGWGTAGEGYLVYDPNDAGNTTVVNQDSQLVAGFDALQALAMQVDGTANGSLTANDALWNSLKVWVDTTGTGQFRSGQLYSLDQLGITSINLNGKRVNQDNNGNQILVDSTFTWANGSTGDIAGVNLMFNPNAVDSSAGSATANLADLQISNLVASMASYGAQPAASSALVVAAQQAPQAMLTTSIH